MGSKTDKNPYPHKAYVWDKNKAEKRVVNKFGAVSTEYSAQAGNFKNFGFVFEWDRNHCSFLSLHDKETNVETGITGTRIQRWRDPRQLFWRISDFRASINFD